MIKRFEVFILRPLWVIFFCFLILFVFKGMWLFVCGAIVSFLYIGVVGSKLHPHQTASDLAKGPLTSEAAVAESKNLSPEMKKTLVDRACTEIGILIGIASGFILWIIVGWHWYFAFIIAITVYPLIGTSLKLIFKTK